MEHELKFDGKVKRAVQVSFEYHLSEPPLEFSNAQEFF